MKKTLPLLLLIACAVIAFLSYQLLKEREDTSTNTKPPCDACKRDLDETQIDESEYDLTLKFDYNSPKFQAIHLDMVSSYGIMARPNKINDSVMDLTFEIQEVGTCKRYYLENFNVSEEKDSVGIRNAYFEINKIKPNDTPSRRSIAYRVQMKEPVEIFDVHIKSDDPDIVSPTDPESTYTIVKKRGDVSIRTYYPPRYCKTKFQG